MDQRIAWAVAEIERRLPEALSVAELALAVNLSPSRFSHLFRAMLGTAPLRYIRGRRMEHARHLLESTFLSVKEVMARVGCNDPSHFTRDFRRHHGIPPSGCRRPTARRSTASITAA